MIEVPFDRLPVDVLQRVIEEYVTREGTDYGFIEYTLAQKVDAVLTQIKNGDVRLCFNDSDQSINIIAR